MTTEFKVGDRVEFCSGTKDAEQGTVVDVNEDGYVIVYGDEMGLGSWEPSQLVLIGFSSAPNYLPGAAKDARTLRDEFAMAALTGLVGREDALSNACLQARAAYILADAMMEARK